MCTRVIYTPKKSKSYVGRNMDWSEQPAPQLWVLPKNMRRHAMAKREDGKEFTWESKYKSIVVSNYDCATSDGLNSEGLTANILWLARSEYPTQGKSENDYPMSLTIWAQYILDTCKNVREAVLAMNNIYIKTTVLELDSGLEKEGNCHLSVGDAKGNSAVFEYLNEELHIYTNVNTKGSKHHVLKYTKKQMRVMTNDPEFNTQIDSLVYWTQLNELYEKDGKPALLPGSNWALSRFVRATYFSDQLPKKADRDIALARLVAVLSNAAQPAVNISKEQALVMPDLSRTQYSSFTNGDDLQYFYRSAYSPFMIWINLEDAFKKNKKLKDDEVYKLELNANGVFKKRGRDASGNVTKYLKPSPMFHFLEAND